MNRGIKVKVLWECKDEIDIVISENATTTGFVKIMIISSIAVTLVSTRKSRFPNHFLDGVGSRVVNINVKPFKQSEVL